MGDLGAATAPRGEPRRAQGILGAAFWGWALKAGIPPTGLQPGTGAPPRRFRGRLLTKPVLPSPKHWATAPKLPRARGGLHSLQPSRPCGVYGPAGLEKGPRGPPMTPPRGAQPLLGGSGAPGGARGRADPPSAPMETSLTPLLAMKSSALLTLLILCTRILPRSGFGSRSPAEETPVIGGGGASSSVPPP